MDKNMKYATVLGLAIGDALGQPFEFSSSEMILKSGWNGGLIGGTRGFDGMWNLKPGQFTDDTLMALAISESLLEKKGFDIDNLASKYIQWVESRDLRGIGIRTESSIHNMMRGISPLESGKKGAGRPKPSFKRLGESPEEAAGDSLYGYGDFCGCGTVMRCAPIGLYFANQNDSEELSNAAKADATMTHDHADARDSSEFLCYMIACAAQGMNLQDSLDLVMGFSYEGDHITRMMTKAIELSKESGATFANGLSLGTSGTAHATLATAIYTLLVYPTFKEAVTASVLIGGDTDSRAAITGALAGTLYGLEGIPEEWVKQVEDSDKLQEIDLALTPDF